MTFGIGHRQGYSHVRETKNCNTANERRVLNSFNSTVRNVTSRIFNGIPFTTSTTPICGYSTQVTVIGAPVDRRISAIVLVIFASLLVAAIVPPAMAPFAFTVCVLVALSRVLSSRQHY